MIRNKLIFMVFFLFTLQAASAHDIIDDVDFNLGNGVYITLKTPTNFTQITIFNSTDSPANTLRVNINQSIFLITPSNNITLRINRFSIADNAYSFTLNGSGSVTISQNLTYASKTYYFYRNNIYSFDIITNSTGWYSKTLSLASGEQTFTYPEIYVSPPTDPPAGGGNNADGGNDGGEDTPPKPAPTATPTPNPTIPPIIPDLSNITNTTDLIEAAKDIPKNIDTNVKEQVKNAQDSISLNLDSIKRDPTGFTILQLLVFLFALLAFYASRKESRMTFGTLIFFILMTVFLAYEVWWA